MQQVSGYRLFWLLTGTTLTTSTSAAAQSADQGMGEIVVTAQRREQRLQDVPIAVSVATPSSLAATNATDLRTLFLAVPGIRSRATAVSGNATYYIRGVGGGAGNGVNIGEEPGVAVYVDGFYYPNVYQSVFSLVDAERVEVLKGPQGTLFGRNALGGVIQVVTREPSKEEMFKGSIAYESYRRIIASAYISGPLTPELSYSLSASKDHQGKGWGYNYTTNREVAKTDYSSVRAKLKFKPSSSFKSMFTFEYGSSSNDLGTILSGLPGGVINGGKVKVDPRVGLFDSQAGPAGLGLNSESYGVQNSTTYDLGAVTLKNLAQYRYSVLDGSWNSPGGPAGVLNTSQHRTDRIFTEEIQIGNSSPGRLSWVAGFFYMYYKSQYVNPGLLQQGSEISTGFQVNLSRQTVKSAAIFG